MYIKKNFFNIFFSFFKKNYNIFIFIFFFFSFYKIKKYMHTLDRVKI